MTAADVDQVAASSAALEWVAALYDGLSGWVYVAGIPPDRRGWEVAGWVELHPGDPGPLHELAGWVNTAGAAGWNLYLPCATRRERGADGRRGGIDSIREARWLWADLDYAGAGHAEGRARLIPGWDEALRVIAELPIAPQRAHDTGRGAHVWHRLAEPVDAEGLRELLPRHAEMWRTAADACGYDVDASVFTADQVMRIPGTPNSKAGGRLCRVLFTHAGAWDLDTLRDELPAPAPPKVRERPAAAATGAPGGDRPGDQLNAAATQQDVVRWWVEHAGYTVTDPDEPSSGGVVLGRPPSHPGDDPSSRSVTVHENGASVPWSTETAALLEGDQMVGESPFHVLTMLKYGGNYGACAADVRRGLALPGLWCEAEDAEFFRLLGVASQQAAKKAAADAELAEAEARRAAGERPPSIFLDWATFWNEDDDDEQWLVEPIIPSGARLTSCTARAKVGKSMLLVAIAAALAVGRAIFGRPASDPINVMYCDWEMLRDDLRSRLYSLGYGPDTDLSHLHYVSLPSRMALPALDSADGGSKLVALAQQVGAQLVVLDTFSRAVDGPEDAADTMRAFFMSTAIKLKAAGIAVVIADHTGHDTSRARGSSAKLDGLDLEWVLSPTDNGLKLSSEGRTRIGGVPPEVIVVKRDAPESGLTEFTPAAGNAPTWPAGTKDTAERLDRLSVALEATVDAAVEALKDADPQGRGKRRNVVSAALKYRRETAERRLFNRPDDGGTG